MTFCERFAGWIAPCFKTVESYCFYLFIQFLWKFIFKNKAGVENFAPNTIYLPLQQMNKKLSEKNLSAIYHCLVSRSLSSTNGSTCLNLIFWQIFFLLYVASVLGNWILKKIHTRRWNSICLPVFSYTKRARA